MGMTFTVKIDTGNDAFGGGTDEGALREEVGRILHAIAYEIQKRARAIDVCQTIHDVNGNDVGRYVHRDEPAPRTGRR